MRAIGELMQQFAGMRPDDPKLEPYFALAEEFDVSYDETASIGKRYRRADEVGTPFCVTVDFETAGDQSVTVRHRDKMTQDRVKITELNAYIARGLKNFSQM